jgi:UDP-MurNAc hydroxylase
MKMTWHSSACVSFESSETKILFDPWLKGSAFLGSWQQWPPAEDALAICLETKYDYIVYTHFHSDHWDPKFLREYLNIWSKRGHNPQILIAKNTWIQLAKSVGSIARDDAKIVLLESGKTFSLNNNGFQLTTWVTDFCDPITCGKLLPCFSPDPAFRAIDSAALIEDEDASVVNLNDGVASGLDSYLQKIGIRADLVMGVFSAAGSFPQCMSNLSSERKKVEKENFLTGAMSRLVLAAERLNAKYIFPFAGQYILSGTLSSLNSERAVIPVSDARDLIQNMTDIQTFTLNSNKCSTFKRGEIIEVGDGYLEPNKKLMSSYLDASNRQYAYELRPIEKVNLLQLFENLEAASSKLAVMYKKMEKFDYSIQINAKDTDFFWNLEFGRELSFGSFKTSQVDHSKITLDLRLLDGCVRRKGGYEGFTAMHWNQAHIGSHLRFDQTKYNPAAHYLLNFLHV